MTVRARIGLAAGVLVVAAAGGLAAAALLAWPHVRLVDSQSALARVELASFAGRVTHVSLSAGGTAVPVQLRGDRLWPMRPLAQGERVSVELTVTRPSWAGWLVGRRERRTFAVRTPAAHLLGRWLQVPAGHPVEVAFDAPVARVAVGRAPARTLRAPTRTVAVPASGRTGSVELAGAARAWERLPARVRVTWFPARPYPQLLVKPALGARIAPDAPLTLTFSRPVRDVLGSAKPRLEPATAGSWRLLDAHTLSFRPSGELGYGIGTPVTVRLPHEVEPVGGRLTRTLRWQVPPGSTLRLQQLLAELGYLPVAWHPATAVRSELAAAVAPPPGRFTWRYAHTPAELKALWQPGRTTELTTGAVMMFQDEHDLAVDGIAGPRVWRALIADVLAGTHRSGGYSYVFVHRTVPQSLNLWHDGRVILTSPGNTGVPAAPTALGTFAVFEHIPIGRMSGTNPDGSHYDDPGIRWISYFHDGEAIHAFNRASFGTPQSLGCVELPLDAAAKVWPYTPIGTLVTIED